jgi:8-oxo-dGTP diphosphatase
MVRTRRRGTALVETPKGILVVSKNGRTFLTPGGGARPRESGQDAAIRELKEETGLKVVEIAYLFDFTGVTHRGTRGGLFKNAHKVYLATATGVPRPSREIKSVAYYDGSSPRISYSARRIIARYRTVDRSRLEYAAAKCPNDGAPIDVRGSPPQVKCPYDGAILHRDPKGEYRPK